MKLSTIVAAAALALGGTAIAGDNAGKSHDATHAGRGAHAQAPKGEGLGDKIRRGMHRMGEKTRHALHRKDADRTGANAYRGPDDTRAMGASGSQAPRNDDGDRARRQRMDDAYANWQRRQDGTQNR